MKAFAPLICAFALAVPALAADGDRPLTGAEFEALTTGHTMTYESGGEPYGTEQYLPGRKVVWAFTGDDCKKGTWYEEGAYICFVYDDEPDPQCWIFHRNGSGLTAQFRGDPEGLPLVAVNQTAKPMACMGPDIGV